MAKANISTANGTTIVVEGTPEEVSKIIAAVGGASTPSKPLHGEKLGTSVKAIPSKNPKKSGLTGLILDLKAEGYFKEKRFLNDVRLVLEQSGHIYPNTTVAPILLALTKLKELGRVKDGAKWAYVHRG
ncbi:MAG: hypothetical protein WCH20_06995 [Nitrospira sp.]